MLFQVDNGLIFQFAHAAAKALTSPNVTSGSSKSCKDPDPANPPFLCSNGDLRVSNAAYPAIFDILNGSTNGDSVKKHFGRVNTCLFVCLFLFIFSK